MVSEVWDYKSLASINTLPLWPCRLYINNPQRLRGKYRRPSHAVKMMYVSIHDITLLKYLYKIMTTETCKISLWRASRMAHKFFHTGVFCTVLHINCAIIKSMSCNDCHFSILITTYWIAFGDYQLICFSRIFKPTYISSLNHLQYFQAWCHPCFAASKLV